MTTEKAIKTNEPPISIIYEGVCYKPLHKVVYPDKTIHSYQDYAIDILHIPENKIHSPGINIRRLVGQLKKGYIDVAHIGICSEQ